MANVEGTYAAVAEWGYCRICKWYRDLRCGCCISCARRVANRKLRDGSHELWCIDDPENKWKVRTN